MQTIGRDAPPQLIVVVNDLLAHPVCSQCQAGKFSSRRELREAVRSTDVMQSGQRKMRQVHGLLFVLLPELLLLINFPLELLNFFLRFLAELLLLLSFVLQLRCRCFCLSFHHKRRAPRCSMTARNRWPLPTAMSHDLFSHPLCC